MEDKPTKRTVKITLFGDAAVGKTSLIARYVENVFADKYISTIGTKISKKVVNVKQPFTNKPYEVTMVIWDIVGQKDYRALLQERYFEGAAGAIGVCDVTRRQTYDDLQDWRKSVCGVAGNIPMIFLGNKSDLKENITVTEDDLKNAIMSYADCISEDRLRDLLLRGKKPYMYASAKTGLNVENAFAVLAEAVA